MSPREKTLASFLNFVFYTVILLELFLLGSGQFVSLHGFSLRMFLYVVAIIFGVLLLVMGAKLQYEVICFLILYCFMLVFSSFVGVVNGASMSDILQNLKPLLFGLMVVPFAFYVSDESKVIYVSKLIRISGVALAVLFLVLLGLLWSGYVDFSYIYVVLSSEANDFMINDGDFIRIFYKGFLYIGIAFIFYSYVGSSARLSIMVKYLVLSFLFIALILTFTRGLVLALIFSYIVIALIELKRRRNIIILFGLVFFSSVCIPYFLQGVGDRTLSDSVRLTQVEQVFAMVTPLSVLFGHGYGVGVPVRPDGMEITFLEVFHKQGLPGLFLWFGFLGYCIFKFLNLSSVRCKEITRPFLVSMIFVYLQSFTNPYANNPIGMSMLLLGFLALLVLSREDEKRRLCS